VFGEEITEGGDGEAVTGWSEMERSVVEVTEEKQIYSILYRYVGRGILKGTTLVQE